MAANTMATIEPRLMHLLNVNDSRDHLPSIHSTLVAPANPGNDDGLLLPPLDLAAADPAGSPGISKHTLQASSTGHATSSSFVASGNGESSSWPVRSGRSSLGEAANHGVSADFLGRLDEAPSATSASVIGKRPHVLPHTEELIHLPQPLKMQKSNQQVGSLSQPFPPIINGLHEPPPNAAVFPPIASAEFDADDALRGTVTDGRAGATGPYLNDVNLAGLGASSVAEFDRTEDISSKGPKLLPATTVSSLVSRKALNVLVAPTTLQTSSTLEAPSCSAFSKPKRRATKPRRRWTEEETDQLLIGVSRHGLGKWTAILEDPEFSFCNRTAGDLKDRFRTCCPDELRGTFSKSDPPATAPTGSSTPPLSAQQAVDGHHLKPKTSLSLENILIESDEHLELHQDQGIDAPGGTSTTPIPSKQRKRRVHRKNMEDMEKLGIRGPFKKSHRRERRPFTEQDDKEILEGLQIYGPAWTKIHRHGTFNLSSRQPTDLRDRVRNKYPETYANIEKGIFQPQSIPSGKGSNSTIGVGSSARRGSITNLPNTPMEPSVSISIESSCLTGNNATEISHPLTSSTDLPPLRRLSTSHDGTTHDGIPLRVSHPSTVLHAGPAGSQDTSAFELGESTPSFLGNVGEMGISRLLLDNPQMSSYHV